MSMDPIAAIGVMAPMDLSSGIGAAGSARAQPPSQVDFGRWMTDQLREVNGQIEVAERSLVRLAAGDGNLHQVMLDLEKARTAFQLTLQVRNKLLEGYQDIMRMQI